MRIAVWWRRCLSVVVLVQASGLSAKGQSSQAVRRSAWAWRCALCGRRVKRFGGVGKGRQRANRAKLQRTLTDFGDRRCLGDFVVACRRLTGDGTKKVVD